MNIIELENQMKKLQEYELEIVKNKSIDYSGEKDVFCNFNWFGEFGFLVRMFDKMMRIKHIIENKGYKIKNETLKDTLVDLVNYANLLILYLDRKNRNIRKE